MSAYKSLPFNWVCPHCENKTTINKDNYSTCEHEVAIQNSEGQMLLITEWIVCPNTDCLRASLRATVHKMHNSQFGYGVAPDPMHIFSLLPKSNAKSFPEYIPKPLRVDYEEAVAIQYLSAKASATLLRRCLQGMIRDFWKVIKHRLVDEINAIEELVDPITWKSIDAVRKVGNIGAHMEKDINLVIDVEPNEARLLIELVELLFEEWYVHRYEREVKLSSLINMAESKGT